MTHVVLHSFLACEDCGEDPYGRRIQCVHCGLYICGWCWHHVHGCGPGHATAQCRDRRRVQRMPPRTRRLYFKKLRARSLKAQAAGAVLP